MTIDNNDDGESIADTTMEADAKTPEEKESARIERKKQNAHKIAYKKLNYAITSKKGPRAV